MPDDLSYHVEVYGAGEPLLLLHGFTGSTQSWHELVPQLSAAFQLILVDLPGHGTSATPDDPARCTLPAVAADLCAILAQRQALPAHVLGYSMGGRLALYMALHTPQCLRSLIVESGSPGLPTEAERAARRADDEALAQRIERAGIAAFVDEWERLPLWASQRALPSATRQHLREQRLHNSALGLASSLRGMGTGAQPSLWDELPRLTVPTLLVTGALDAKFTQIAQAMQSRCPACVHRILPAAGHTPHLETPALFARTVLDFLGP